MASEQSYGPRRDACEVVTYEQPSLSVAYFEGWAQTVEISGEDPDKTFGPPT